jgi:hypothetical protein
MDVECSSANSEHHSFTDLPENATGDHDNQTFQSTDDQSFNGENIVQNINDALQDDIDQQQQEHPEQGSEQSGSSYSTRSENNVQLEAGTYGPWNEGEDSALADGDDVSLDSDEAAEPRWRQPDESFWPGHTRDVFYGVELPELLTRYVAPLENK